MSPITKQDLETFLNERDARMKDLITDVFRKEMSTAIEPFKKAIQEIQSGVDQCKNENEVLRHETEAMIANESKLQLEKESQLFITGVKSHEEVTKLIKEIIGVDPDIKFAEMLSRKENVGDDSKNCLIGLNGNHAKEVLRKKAKHMKDNQNMKNIGIRQSLTPLQIRVHDGLQKEMIQKKEQTPPPKGMDYFIRNGMVKILPVRTKN